MRSSSPRQGVKLRKPELDLGNTNFGVAASLEAERDRLDRRNETLQSEVDRARDQIQRLTLEVETERRTRKYELEDKSREHKYEVEELRRYQEELRREFADETERLQRTHREALEAVERHYRVELEDERNQQSKEVQELKSQMSNEQQDLHLTLQKKDGEIQNMRASAEDLKGDLDLHVFLGLAEGHAGFDSITATVRLKSTADPEAIAALHDKVRNSSPVGHTLGSAVPLTITAV